MMSPALSNCIPNHLKSSLGAPGDPAGDPWGGPGAPFAPQRQFNTKNHGQSAPKMIPRLQKRRQKACKNRTMFTKCFKVVLSLLPTPPETISTLLMPPTIRTSVHRVSGAGGRGEALRYNSSNLICICIQLHKNEIRCCKIL